MRAWTTAEAMAYATTSPKRDVRVQVRDSAGVLQDWTDLNGVNHVREVEWGDSLTQDFGDGVLSLIWRRTPGDNMSPFAPGGRYTGYLAAWREVVISTKVYPSGSPASGFAWKEVFRGRIDDFDLSSHPGKVYFRDKIGAELMDQFSSTSSRYSIDAADDIEDVIADILSDHDREGNTLYVPTPTGLGVNEWTVQSMPIMRAIQDLAFAAGWDVRPRWYESAGEFRLTLYEPERSSPVSVHTFPRDHVEDWGEFRFSLSNVRNWVKVVFGRADQENSRAFVERLSETSPANDPDGSAVLNSSIDRYGWRFMQLVEPSTAPLIQTIAQAEALADSALRDLEDPTLIAGVVLPYYFWPVELNDYITLEADGRIFNTDTDVAVHGYRHRIGPDGMSTSLNLQGKPALATAVWLRREARPGQGAPPDDLAPPAPTLTVEPGQFDVTVDVDYPDHLDYDQIHIYASQIPFFTPSESNRIYVGRASRHTFPKALNATTYYKAKIRDKSGNLSAAASAAFQGSSLGRSVGSSVGLFDATTLSGEGAVPLNTVRSGEYLGWFNTRTNRLTAYEGGTYEVDFRTAITTAMAESTDYTIDLVRDPDGDAEVIAQAVVAGDSASFRDLVRLDEGDELEVQVVDAGGTFANITFDGDKTRLIATKTDSPETRSSPGRNDLPIPTYLEPDLVTEYDANDGITQDMVRIGGRVLITTSRASNEYPGVWVQKLRRAEYEVGSVSKAGVPDDVIEVPSSSDYFFTAASYSALNTGKYSVFLGFVDHTNTEFGVRQYDRENTAGWTADLGGAGGIVVRGICATAALEDVWACTTEPSGVGKIRRLNASSGTVEETSSDVGAALYGAALLDDDSLVITAGNVQGASAYVYAYDGQDLSAEVWSLEIVDDVGGAVDSGENVIRATPDGFAAYMTCGPSSNNSHLYKISSGGTFAWVRDVADDTTLDGVTYCSGLDVHEGGDVYVVAVYDDGSVHSHEVLIYRPDGTLRWQSGASRYSLTIADETWDDDEDPLIAVGSDGTIYLGVSGGRLQAIGQYENLPQTPPQLGLTYDINPEQLALSDGDGTRQLRDSKGGLILRQMTSANRPAYRSAGGTLGRPCLDYDGSNDVLVSVTDLVALSGGFRWFVVAEFDTIAADVGFFEVIPNGETPATPAAVVFYDDTANKFTYRVNADGSPSDYESSESEFVETGAPHVWHGGGGLWLDDLQFDPSSGLVGATNTGPLSLGQGLNGAKLNGKIYRALFYAESTVAMQRTVQHWLRAWYGIDALTVAELDPVAQGMIAVSGEALSSLTYAATAEGLVTVTGEGLTTLTEPTLYPSVRSSDAGTDSSGTRTVTLPADVEPGDILIVMASSDDPDAAATIGIDDYTPDGITSNPWNWVELANETGWGSGYAAGVWAKVADGSEGGIEVDLTGSLNNVSWVTVAMQDTSETLWGVEASSTQAADSSPDSPSLSPNWGSGDTWWGSVAFLDGNSTPSEPTDYTDVANATVGTSPNKSSTWLAERENTTATEDPGTWGSSSDSSNHAAATIAVEVTRDTPADPDDIFGADLEHWWDMTDLSTMWQDTGGTTAVASDGDPVARVDDKGTAADNLTQGTGSAQPAYAATGMNGGPGVDFQNDLLAATASNNLTEFTVFIALQDEGTNGAIFDNTSRSGYTIINSDSSGGQEAETVRLWNGSAVTEKGHCGTSWVLEIGVGDDEVGLDFTDYESVGTWGSNTISSGDTIQIGRPMSGSFPLEAVVAEVVIVSRAVTQEERHAMMRYFDDHHGTGHSHFMTAASLWWEVGTKVYNDASLTPAEIGDDVDEWGSNTLIPSDNQTLVTGISSTNPSREAGYIEFDGVDEALYEFATPGAEPGTDDFTALVWVYGDADEVATILQCSSYSGSTELTSWKVGTDGSGNVEVEVYDLPSRTTDTASWTTSEWSLVGIRIDRAADTVEAIADGVPSGSATSVGASEDYATTGSFFVGGEFSYSGSPSVINYFDGRVGDIMVFEGVALTDAQITEISDRGPGI